jgi:hypothetical protein
VAVELLQQEMLALYHVTVDKTKAAAEAVVLEDLRLMEHLLIYLHAEDHTMDQKVDLE